MNAKKSLAIAVIQGGPASEAEVSRASAASVARALTTAGHRVVRLELNAYLADSLRTGGFEVVFPVSHGAVGEDGSLQGLLEVLDMPYVGSGVLASALAMNKRAAKILFAEAGLPIAKSIAARRTGQRTAATQAQRAIDVLQTNKVVVKPCSNGSAIGVARLSHGASMEEIEKAIEAAWAVDDVALVETFVEGREVTCGVIELPGRDSSLPPTEIMATKDAFYTYEARYAPGRSQHVCPAELGSEALVRRVREVAVLAHRALGCRDLSRVDFVVPTTNLSNAANGAEIEPTLLEVNTMPGFTDTSLYPEAAAIAGIPMPELCNAFALQAFARGSTRRNVALPLPK